MEITYFSSVVGAVILAIIVGGYVSDDRVDGAAGALTDTGIELSEKSSEPKAARGYNRPANVVQAVSERSGERDARGLNRGKSAHPIRTMTSVPLERQKRTRNGNYEIAAR